MLARLLIPVGLALVLGGCQTGAGGTASLPSTASPARTSPALQALPAPTRRVHLAVYDFPDLTGAHKPNPIYADYSKAVTQGGAAVLVDALRKAGRGSWFRVVERTGLANLLKERELIQTTATALKRSASAEVAPLSFAEYLLEGGIVSYDSDLEAGGIGASYLGVKADASYSKDKVTVALRMTEVRTGDVVLSITSSSTIYSTSVSAGLTRFVSVDDLLTVSGGVTRSDATQVAVQEAIEAAVIQLVQDGLEVGLWSLRGEAEPAITGSVAPASAPPLPKLAEAPASRPAAARPPAPPAQPGMAEPLHTGAIGDPVPLASLVREVPALSPPASRPAQASPLAPDQDFWIGQLRAR